MWANVGKPRCKSLALLFVAQAFAGCGEREAVEVAGPATVVRAAPAPTAPGDASDHVGAPAPGENATGAPVATTPAPSAAVLAPAQPNDGLVLRFAGSSYGVEPAAAAGELPRLVATPTAPTALTYARWTLATSTGCLAAEDAGGGEVVVAPCADANVLRWEFVATFGYVFRPTGAASLPWYTVAERPCRATAGTCLNLTPAPQLVAADVTLDAAATPPRPVRGVPIYALAQPNTCLRDAAGALTLADCDVSDAGQAWSFPFLAGHQGERAVRSGLGNCLDASDPRAPVLRADCALAASHTDATGFSNGSIFVVVDGLGHYLTLDAQQVPAFDGAGYPPAFGYGPAR